MTLIVNDFRALVSSLQHSLIRVLNYYYIYLHKKLKSEIIYVFHKILILKLDHIMSLYRWFLDWILTMCGTEEEYEFVNDERKST